MGQGGQGRLLGAAGTRDHGARGGCSGSILPCAPWHWCVLGLLCVSQWHWPSGCAGRRAVGTGDIGRAHTDASSAGAGAGPPWWGPAGTLSLLPIHRRSMVRVAGGVSHLARVQPCGTAQGAPGSE